jgi:hypothetical protein
MRAVSSQKGDTARFAFQNCLPRKPSCASNLSFDNVAVEKNLVNGYNASRHRFGIASGI